MRSDHPYPRYSLWLPVVLCVLVGASFIFAAGLHDASAQLRIVLAMHGAAWGVVAKWVLKREDERTWIKWNEELVEVGIASGDEVSVATSFSILRKDAPSSPALPRARTWLKATGRWTMLVGKPMHYGP